MDARVSVWIERKDKIVGKVDEELGKSFIMIEGNPTYHHVDIFIENLETLRKLSATLQALEQEVLRMEEEKSLLKESEELHEQIPEPSTTS